MRQCYTVRLVRQERREQKPIWLNHTSMPASFPPSIQSVPPSNQQTGRHCADAESEERGKAGTPGVCACPPPPPTHRMRGWGLGVVPGRAPEKAPPLPSTSCGRGRENVSAVADPAACPLRAETRESVLPRPFGSRARSIWSALAQAGRSPLFQEKRLICGRRPPRTPADALPPLPCLLPLGSLPLARSLARDWINAAECSLLGLRAL